MEDLVEHVKTFASWPGSEFWAATVGAVVGGLITLVIQRQEQKAARRDRADDRRTEAQGQAYSLLFKVMAIHSTFHNLRSHVDECLARGKSARIQRISPVLLPIANPPMPVDFAPSEMAMLLSLKNDAVFNSLASLDRVHNSIIPVWTMYEAKRSQIPPQGKDHQFDPEDGKGEFSVQRGSHLEALMYEVEQLAVEMADRAVRDEAEAARALEVLVPLLNDRLKLGIAVK